MLKKYLLKFEKLKLFPIFFQNFILMLIFFLMVKSIVKQVKSLLFLIIVKSRLMFLIIGVGILSFLNQPDCADAFEENARAIRILSNEECGMSAGEPRRARMEPEPGF